MKTYVKLTGTIFALIAASHIWRVIEEGPRLLTQTWWVLITVAAAALAAWAWRLVR